MGFGVKTDFKTGREIDLDKTYKTIIKPVFDDLGFICYRADDIKHSGVIDLPMYENILKADFVIADISTLNPNVLYELGIRHAVRKATTLIIAEKELQYPFDISHLIIDSYEHLGKAIDYDEVMRFRKLLSEKVKTLSENPGVDSPLYTLLPNLQTPTFTQEEIEEIKEGVKEERSASDLLTQADEARKSGNFPLAIELLNEVRSLLPRNDYIIQKLALVTYKSELPNKGTALFNAESILEVLKPEKTTDPETLGLSGAINKRLYELYGEVMYLAKSLAYYERGFFIKQDYYNGINVAFLKTIMSSLEKEQFEAYAHFGHARMIRKRVIEICEGILKEETFKGRDDKEWIFLTLAEASFGLDEFEREKEYLLDASKVSDGEFGLRSYTEQRSKIEGAVRLFKQSWGI